MANATQGLLNQSGVSHVKWVPLHEVTEAGSYVSRDTGDLIRLAGPGGQGESLSTGEPGDDRPVVVTRISSDPYLAIGQLRLAAANLDLEIDF